MPDSAGSKDDPCSRISSGVATAASSSKPTASIRAPATQSRSSSGNSSSFSMVDTSAATSASRSSPPPAPSSPPPSSSPPQAATASASTQPRASACAVTVIFIVVPNRRSPLDGRQARPPPRGPGAPVPRRRGETEPGDGVGGADGSVDREGAQRDLDLVLVAVTGEGDGDLVAGGVAPDGGRQVGGVADRVAVDGGDDVALLQAGLLGRAAGLDRAEQGAAGVGVGDLDAHV